MSGLRLPLAVLEPIPPTLKAQRRKASLSASAEARSLARPSDPCPAAEQLNGASSAYLTTRDAVQPGLGSSAKKRRTFETFPSISVTNVTISLRSLLTLKSGRTLVQTTSALRYAVLSPRPRRTPTPKPPVTSYSLLQICRSLLLCSGFALTLLMCRRAVPSTRRAREGELGHRSRRPFPLRRDLSVG